MRPLRLQSAMEYLMTYSWAILVISVVLIALYALGLFNLRGVTGTQCVFQAGLQCLNVFIGSNGLLSIALLQATTAPINISALGCAINRTVGHMYNIYNPPTNQIEILIGGNYTFNVQCWANGAQYTATPGTSFDGYVFVNYTDTVTGFPHLTIGQIAVEVT